MSKTPYFVESGEGGFPVPVKRFSSYEMIQPGVYRFMTTRTAEQLHGAMQCLMPVDGLQQAFGFALNEIAYKKNSAGIYEPGIIRGMIMQSLPGLGKSMTPAVLAEILGYEFTVADCTNQTLNNLIVEVGTNGHTIKTALDSLIKWLEGPQAVHGSGRAIVENLEALCKAKGIATSYQNIGGNQHLKLDLRSIAGKEYKSGDDPLMALNLFAQQNNLLSQKISAGVEKWDGPLLTTLLRANARGEAIRAAFGQNNARQREKGLAEAFERYGVGDIFLIDEYTRRLREGIAHDLYAVIGGGKDSFIQHDAAGDPHVISAKNLRYGNFFTSFAANMVTRGERTEMLDISQAVQSRFTTFSVANAAELDFRMAGERALCGMPISNQAIVRQEGDDRYFDTKENQDELSKALLHSRRAGALLGGGLTFDRKQHAHLNEWGDTMEAAQRMGKLYAYWRELVESDDFVTMDDNGNMRKRPEIDCRKIIQLIQQAERGGIETISFKQYKETQEKGDNLMSTRESTYGDRVVEALQWSINMTHGEKIDEPIKNALQAKMVELKILPKDPKQKASGGEQRKKKAAGERLLADLLNVTPHIELTEELGKYQLMIAASIVARNHGSYPEGHARRISDVPSASKGKDPFDPVSYKEEDLRKLLPLHVVVAVSNVFKEVGAGELSQSDLPPFVRRGRSIYGAMMTTGARTGEVVARPEEVLVVDPYAFHNSSKGDVPLVAAADIKSIMNNLEMPSELLQRQGLGAMAAMPGGQNILKEMLFTDAPLLDGDSSHEYIKMLCNQSAYGVGVTTILADKSDKKAEGLLPANPKTTGGNYFANPIHIISGPTSMLMVGSHDLPQVTAELMQAQHITYVNRLSKTAETQIDEAMKVIIDNGMQQAGSKGKREELEDGIKLALSTRHVFSSAIKTTFEKDRKNISFTKALCDLGGEVQTLAGYIPTLETDEMLGVLRGIADKMKTKPVSRKS